MRRSKPVGIAVAICLIAGVTLPSACARKSAGVGVTTNVSASARTYRGTNGLTLTTYGLALYPDYCGNASYRIVGNYRLAAYWDVDVTVTDPKGRWDGGGYYYKGGDASTISDKVYLCANYDTGGTYKVAVAVEEWNGNYDLQRKYSLNGYFTFARIPKASSRLTVRRTKSGRHSWNVKGRLTRSGRSWASRYVQLQAYTYGSWYRLPGTGSKRTDRYGRVAWRSTPSRSSAKIRLRLYFGGDSKTRAAGSPTFRVSKR